MTEAGAPRLGPRIEAVLFDLDGTLVDSQGAWRGAFAEVVTPAKERYPALARLGAPEQIFERVFAPLVAGEHRAAGGGEWSEDFVRNAFRRLLAEHSARDDALGDALFEAYHRAWPRHIALFPDARATLRTLAGRYRLALVSNGRSQEQRLKIDLLDLAPHFEAVSISEELGALKPHPAIFRHALDALGADPASAVHVGDDPYADVAGAKAAGLAAVWVNRGGDAQQAPDNADVEVSALAELPPLLGVHGTGLGGPTALGGARLACAPRRGAPPRRCAQR